MTHNSEEKNQNHSLHITGIDQFDREKKPIRFVKAIRNLIKLLISHRPLKHEKQPGLPFLRLWVGSIRVLPFFWSESTYITAMYVSLLLLMMPFFIS